jgi:FtsH-binding integral membrane protein
MSESLTYQQTGAPTREQAHTLFAQTMGDVAATAGPFALGAWLGRHLAGGAGIVLIFVNIPGGALIYSVLGLVIFAGFTLLDFQRIRSSRDTSSAPLLAASIFLDILNVFLFFLQIFSREQ